MTTLPSAAVPCMGIPEAIDCKRPRPADDDAACQPPPKRSKAENAAEALAVLRRSIGNHSISYESYVPKKGKNQFSRHKFMEKFDGLVGDGPTLIALANALANARVYHYNEKLVLFLLCPLCDTFREATTDNFAASNVNGKTEEWFAKMPHLFYMGKRGCNSCHAQQMSVKVSDGDEYLKHLGAPYPAIWNWYTDAEKEAIKTKYREENGRDLKKVPRNDRGLAHLREHVGKRCPVSGVIMNDSKSDPFCVSIDSVKLQGGAYDIHQNHSKEDIRIVAAFVNIRQTDTNIPDLNEAFRSMFAASIRAVLGKDTKKEAAALASVGRPYPPVICSLAGHGAQADQFQQDRRGGERVLIPRATPRRNDLETAAKVAAFLRDKRMRCATSGVVVGLKSGWNKAHLDRIDDADGHNKANVELKCALFMGRTKVSRKQYLKMILEQNAVFVPKLARKLFKAELRTM